MALSRDKKNQLVAELSAALKDAKMTAFAEYQGLTVKDLQELRKDAGRHPSALVAGNRLRLTT
jgi:ribosomal protein L10